MLWFIYRYLILVRAPYAINANVSTLTLVFVIVIFLAYTLQNLLVMKQLLGRSSTLPGANLIKELLDLVFYKPLELIRDYLMKYRWVRNRITECALVLEYTITSKRLVYVVSGSLLLVPRVILAAALFIDIIVLAKIVVFLQTLWVLSISIIFWIVLNTLRARYTYCSSQIFDILLASELAQVTTYSLGSKLVIKITMSLLWFAYIYKLLKTYTICFISTIIKLLLFTYL